MSTIDSLYSVLENLRMVIGYISYHYVKFTFQQFFNQYIICPF